MTIVKGKPKPISLADVIKNTNLDPVFEGDTKVDEVKIDGAWEVVTVKLDSGDFD